MISITLLKQGLIIENNNELIEQKGMGFNTEGENI